MFNKKIKTRKGVKKLNESDYLYEWSNQVIGARMLAQNLYDEINSDGSIKYNKKQVLKLLKLLNESKENMSDFLYGKGEIYWKVEKKKDGKFDFANANPCMKRKNRLLNVDQMTHLIESVDYLKK